MHRRAGIGMNEGIEAEPGRTLVPYRVALQHEVLAGRSPSRIPLA